ncbi:MAG TPA: response regulator [Urbifossiella sp.]
MNSSTTGSGLTVARPAKSDSSSTDAAASAPRRLTGVVLLVEDEPSVRTVTRRMMEMRGLTVLLAETPDEAIRIAAGHSGPIDLLLTDVQLPGMNGPELAEQLRAGQPNLKIVFISGYPRDEAFADSLDDETAEYLQKPFTPTQLIEVLSRVLMEKSTGNLGDTPLPKIDPARDNPLP